MGAGPILIECLRAGLDIMDKCVGYLHVQWAGLYGKPRASSGAAKYD